MLKKLLGLSPTEFENLVYDLMQARGMINVTWRTPGADGGRDIEGQVLENDFSDSRTSTQWYIECKRYASSVDWPTVYGKIAFADANSADVLLMCTTSKFTPTAITQADNWNAKKSGLTVRLWPGHKLESMLGLYPDIAMKYGLEASPTALHGSTLEIALALSKTVGSHYSNIIFSAGPVSPMLDASRMLALLLQRRMEDVALSGRFNVIPFNGQDIDLENCVVDSGKYTIDEASFCAFLGYLGVLAKCQLTVERISEDQCKIVSTTSIKSIFENYGATFKAIALWGNFDYKTDDFHVVISQRSA